VTDIDGLTPEICIIVAIWDNDMGREWPEVSDALLASTSPLLLHSRAGLAAELGRPEDRDWLHAYILRDGMTDTGMAMHFDFSYAAEGQISPVAHIVHQRARDKAREVLAYDPYNRAMLNIMIDTPSRTIGYVTYPTDGIDPPLGEEDRLRYLFDAIEATPYDATAWQMLARFRRGTYPEDTVPYAFPAWANAIAYTNHNPHMIKSYVEDMASRYREVESRSEPLGWTTEAQIAAQEPYLCEIVRAVRLHVAICDWVGQGTYGCGPAGNGGFYNAAALADLVALAQSADQCSAQFSAVLDETAYQPIAIPRP
jgi:hypothetical protein